MSDCTARRKDGSPCTVRARPGRAVCAFHDPELQGKRAAARLAGGRGKATSRRLERLTPMGLRPVLDKLYAALDAVEAGAMEPKQATAMAAVASVIVRVYDVAVLGEDIKAITARLDRMETPRGRAG